CVDFSTDRANCGKCGTACTATQSCAAGACGCPSGTMACGPDCVNPKSDPMHCGGCTTVSSGATPVCANGGGAASCAVGQMNCAGACADLMTDPMNCGSCGHA